MKIKTVLSAVTVLLLGLAFSHHARAADLDPSSYSMPNGGSGTYQYFDQTYDGTGDLTTPCAALSGGTGDLTDDIIATANWNASGQTSSDPYVGWWTQDTGCSNPSITFNFDTKSSFESVTLYLDDSDAGGVSPPTNASITVGANSPVDCPISNPAGTVPFSVECDLGGSIGDQVTVVLTHGTAWIMLSEVQFDGSIVQATFETSVQYPQSIDSDTTLNARLECNTGVQLIQNFPISEDVPVIFVVEEFTPFDDVLCTISLTGGINGFDSTATANTHELAGDACVYTFADDLDDSVMVEGRNSCVFEFEQEGFEFTINKVWDFDGETEGIFELAGIEWTCYNVYTAAPTTDKLSPRTFDGAYSVYMDENDEYTVGGLYANPFTGWSPTYCMAEEVFQVDSAVESDQGCAYRTYFAVGDSEKECTIVNTVFFEGIPTLSQYGLAVMILLMLGMGFVGFRRFV
jgi:hypothetical protein